MTQTAWDQLNLAAKRAAFPLRAPRNLTLAWWPVHVFAAAVDGYFEAFFMALTPRAAGAVSLADAVMTPPGSEL